MQTARQTSREKHRYIEIIAAEGPKVPPSAAMISMYLWEKDMSTLQLRSTKYNYNEIWFLLILKDVIVK